MCRGTEREGFSFSPTLDCRVTVTQFYAIQLKSTAFAEYAHACPVALVVRLFATPRIPLSMGFSRQRYWSGLLCPPPGDLADPDIEPRSTTLQADFLLLSRWGSPC